MEFKVLVVRLQNHQKKKFFSEFSIHTCLEYIDTDQMYVSRIYKM